MNLPKAKSFKDDGIAHYNDQACATLWHRAALRAMRSKSTMRDGSVWIHVSVSRKDRCPTWEEMSLAKNDLIGPDVWAIQVLPPKSLHINLHRFCLHWWSPIEWTTKDFPDLNNLIDEIAV